jgi:selenium donor protein
MHANNEVGTIQDIPAIGAIAREHDILVHTDCAQSVGKIPVRVDDLNVDLLTVAGHKLYAPKGVGALYIRSGLEIRKYLHGANHEMNRRAGTENVLEIVGLGQACQLISEEQDEITHLKEMRDRLEKGLLSEIDEVRVNGHPEWRLPNTCSISFRGLEANTILSELEMIAASAGAACHAESVELSHVLEAMNVPVEYAMGTIRLSTGRFTTITEIDTALVEIKKVIQRLKPTSGFGVAVDEQTKEVKLTRYTHGLGCACKLRPQVLESVLRKLPPVQHADVLVGTDKADDAAVYRIDDKTAVVQTVDFFTPIVDDPFQFGAIAAVNSLSDIYAMGAKPLFALNIVGFPSNRLPVRVLEQILQGAQSVARKAGIHIIGGHTVDDTEPKFGLAVTGLQHPDRIIRNDRAQPGDVLILTKPIGTGILSTALKQGSLTENLQTNLVDTMLTLNRAAAEAMQEAGVNSCTDVTGFGLLGHLLEMMKGSGTAAQIYFGRTPVLEGALDLAVSGVIPGGTRDNFAFTKSYVSYHQGLSEAKKLLLNDAQTSGGLLISVPEKRKDKMIHELKKRKVKTISLIGEVTAPGEKYISVRTD